MAITHPLYEEVIAWVTHSGQTPSPTRAMSTTNDMAEPSLTAPSRTSSRHAAPTASRKSGADDDDDRRRNLQRETSGLNFTGLEARRLRGHAQPLSFEKAPATDGRLVAGAGKVSARPSRHGMFGRGNRRYFRSHLGSRRTGHHPQTLVLRGSPHRECRKGWWRPRDFTSSCASAVTGVGRNECRVRMARSHQDNWCADRSADWCVCVGRSFPPWSSAGRHLASREWRSQT